LWADRFDGSLEDIFDLQDKVASGVAGVIEPALQAAETERSAGRPTTDLTAYDFYLPAYSVLLSSAKQIPEALHLLERAIERLLLQPSKQIREQHTAAQARAGPMVAPPMVSC